VGLDKRVGAIFLGRQAELAELKKLAPLAPAPALPWIGARPNGAFMYEPFSAVFWTKSVSFDE
jgi:hypothetical protein